MFWEYSLIISVFYCSTMPFAKLAMLCGVAVDLSYIIHNVCGI